MPISDIQGCYNDYGICTFCGKIYPDNLFVPVLVDNDKTGKAKEYRRYEMCIQCRKKCASDKDFERYVTNKVFTLKLGRKIIKRDYDGEKNER